jgi:hypothetical protein
MGTFRKVEAENAGPHALGILIPPSRRTFVILRPRGLPWDLLLCRGSDDLSFREMSHDEASAAAQAVYRALRDGAVVEAAPQPDGCAVLLNAGPFVLIACERRPGQPYAAFASGEEEARAAADSLGRVVSPPEGSEQEVYFNVRFFERQPNAGGPA